MRKVEGQSDPVGFHDPTTLAVAGLSAICSGSEALLDIFFNAGGISAVVRVLGESGCPNTLLYTGDFIRFLQAEIILPGAPHECQDLAEWLLLNRTLPNLPVRYQELADAFFHSGG